MNSPTHLRTAPTTRAEKELEEKLAKARQTVAEAEAKLEQTVAEAEAKLAEAKSHLAEVEQECEAAGMNCALPEVWALVAKHSGLVGAWQLMRVCRASRAGAMQFLSTLPGLVVCGGESEGSEGVERVSDVWRVDLATLRWVPMPALVTGR
jgi:hypothetical protein